MKTNLLKKISYLLIVGFFISCGGGSNNDTNTAYDPYGIPGGNGGIVGSTIQQVLNSKQCPRGGTRFRADFNTRNRNGSAIFGPYSRGAQPGAAGSTFIGISEGHGDVIVVSSVTNGATTIGHNINLYICPYIDPTAGQILGPNVIIDHLTDANMGITLMNNASCPTGTVTALITYTSSGFYNGTVEIETAFSPYYCSAY